MLSSDEVALISCAIHFLFLFFWFKFFIIFFKFTYIKIAMKGRIRLKSSCTHQTVACNLTEYAVVVM